MRVTWAAALVLWGVVAACGFYDAVPRPSDPFGPDLPLPNLPDASVAIPDGGEVFIGDGGYRDRDGGIHIPGGDGGFELPDGGLPPDAGMDAGIDCGELPGDAQVLARGEYLPSTLAVSPTEVFWVDGHLSLRRVPKSGGSVKSVLTLATDALQVDAEAAYVVTLGSGYALTKVPHDGSGLQQLHVWSGWAPASGELVQSGGALVADVDDDLFAVGKAGGEARLLRSGSWREALAADDAGVYFSELASTQLIFIPTDGGTPAVFATLAQGFHAPRMQTGPSGLAVAVEPLTSDPWACPGGSLLRRSSSGTGLTAFASTSGCVLQLTVDATHAYWTAFIPNSGYFLLRKPLELGGLHPLTRLPEPPRSLVLDDAALYWSQRDTGCIVRLPKPQ